jgi:excisionase family DNA binding protein
MPDDDWLSPHETSRRSGAGVRTVAGTSDLLTPREAAGLFKVRTTTLARWARSGRLPAALTPGGHRRYRLTDVRELLEEREQDLEQWEIDAVRLYEQGWSIRQVAAKFDRGYGIMRRIFKKHTALSPRSAAQAHDNPAAAKTHTPPDAEGDGGPMTVVMREHPGRECADRLKGPYPEARTAGFVQVNRAVTRAGTPDPTRQM